LIPNFGDAICFLKALLRLLALRSMEANQRYWFCPVIITRNHCVKPLLLKKRRETFSQERMGSTFISFSRQPEAGNLNRKSFKFVIVIKESILAAF
jgi:hypothetical protein